MKHNYWKQIKPNRYKKLKYNTTKFIESFTETCKMIKEVVEELNNSNELDNYKYMHKIGSSITFPTKDETDYPGITGETFEIALPKPGVLGIFNLEVGTSGEYTHEAYEKMLDAAEYFKNKDEINREYLNW